VSWIPGWSSIAGTAWWSGFYFWASICALIALGMAEVASHRYSDRKDELAAVEQEAIQRRHDEDMAHVQHDAAQAIERAAQLEKEAAEAKAAIADANARVVEATQKALEAQLALEQFKAPRNLTPEQQDRIASKIKEFSGVQFALSISADNESYQLMKLIRAAVEKAGWIWAAPFGLVHNADGQAAISLQSGVKIQIAPSRDGTGFGTAAVKLAAALTDEGVRPLQN